MNEDFTKPALKIIGKDGNAFAILGEAQRALKKAGLQDKWEEIYAEATSGDYDKLLQTMIKYFDVQ